MHALHVSRTMDDRTLNQQAVLEIGDYIEILRRRKVHFIVPFVLVLAASLILAFTLPPVYRSEATILIEQQEIPADLVESTVTGFVQQRIQGLSKRLLSYDNLWQIAEKYDLYPEDRMIDNKQEIIQRMRENIFVEMVDVKANEPGTTRQGLATIAFTVAFEYEDPEVTRAVTNDLANLYLEENRRIRSEKAADVTKFLEKESLRLNKEISQLESKLASFKQNQREQLPELMNLNLRLHEKTENEIERSKEQIRNLEDRLSALQSELSLTKPHVDIYDAQGQRIQTGRERLSVLAAEYLQLSAKYSQNHPDVVKVRREIEALGAQTSDAAGVKQLVDELTVLRNRLSEARQRYADDHPDVQKLYASIAAVEKGLRNASVSGPAGESEYATAPDNPRYVSLKTQIDAATGSLRAERARLQQLEDKLSEYQERLFKTPTVERDYKSLSRDYDNAKAKYKEIKDKLLEARLAEELEAGSKAERFTLVQAAFLPSLPERPNRIGIALLGTLLAFASGLGSVATAEYMDRTVRGQKGVAQVFGAPPLATIPYISLEKSDKRRS